MGRKFMSNRTAAVRGLMLASAAMMLAQPAWAQETEQAAAEAADVEGTNDIVVTARRRNEILQDVPVAVTAYSGEALEAQGALDLTDIGDTTPNVTLESSRATNSTLTAFIRGVGQQDPVAGFEQGVGIYLDDVYLNRPQAAVLDIYDVERIEVLRGPQGTLYGRNTVGGAVKYVTRRLGRDPELRFRANLGTDQQADLIVSGSAPVGSGVFRVGGSVARLSRGGFGKNLTTGLGNYNKDVWAGRVSAEVNNEDNIFFRLAADYIRDNSNPRGGHRLIPSQLTGAPVLDDVFDTRGGLEDPKQKLEGYGISLFGEIEASDMITLRSISAWRKDDSSTPIDFDALPAIDVDVPGRYHNKQLSQEVQLLVDAGPLNGLIGAYYLDADASTPFDVRLSTSFAGLTAFTDATVHTITYAVFGDFTYDISEQFSVSAGGRYTWDKREAEILRQNYLGGGSPEFGGAGIPFGAPSTNFNGSRKFKKFTPRVSVSFKPTGDHHLYASYSKGFKGGGFDPRGVGANAPDLDGDGIRSDEEVSAFLSFLPETVDSYELGYKGSLLDNRLNFAIAAFRANYKDVQIPGSAACTVGGLPTFCGVVTNAGKARFQGVEFEGNARVAEDLMRSGDRLRLAATLGYMDAEYKEYIANIAATPTDVAEFRRVQNTPKWTASSTLNYNTPLGAGDLNFNTTVSYRSKTVQFEIPNPFIDQKGYSLWDASLVYKAPGDRWTVGIHGKNLLDKHYKTSGYTFMAADPVTGELLTRAAATPVTTCATPRVIPAGSLIPTLGCEGVLSAFYGNPRQVFLTLGYKL
jgi:iron complex outermembrane recepter protein